MAIATSTAAAITAAVALAGAVAGTASALQQSANQQAQNDYQSRLASRNAQVAEQNAQVAEEAARAERRQGYEDAVKKRQEAARIIGSQRAEAGAGGATVDVGSTLDRNLDTAEKGELDALSLRQQAENNASNQDVRAWALRNQATDAQLQSQYSNSRAQTNYLGLTSTLLNGASRVGRNFYTIGARGAQLR